MKIYPAIDMLEGKVVRLMKGDFAEVTTYGDSLADQALTWASAGARMIHIVDLDGARSGQPTEAVWAEAAAAAIPSQVGGGVRTADDARRAIEAGITRVIMGTAAVWNPAVLRDAIELCGADGVVAAMDVSDGRARGEGWLDEGRELGEAVAGVLDAGVTTLLVTAVARDGTLAGPDVELLADVRRLAPDAELISAGGIGTVVHLETLASAGVDGAVIGRALYDGSIDVAEALAMDRRVT